MEDKKQLKILCVETAYGRKMHVCTFQETDRTIQTVNQPTFIWGNESKRVQFENEALRKRRDSLLSTFVFRVNQRLFSNCNPRSSSCWELELPP